MVYYKKNKIWGTMTLKIGIIGSNFVSDWLCQAVLETEEFSLEAIYSRKQETGDTFAAKYNIPNVYTNMEDFLSSDLDAVYIASPNKYHAPHAISALEHGKHVLCEKPIATSSVEWTKMEKAAQKNKVVLLEAMRPAFDPAIQVVKDNLHKIGTIRRAVFEFCQYSSRYDRFKQGEILNAFTPALGNAAVMDIGVYAIHVCAALFGRPLSIDSRSLLLHNGMEGMGNIFLSYDSFFAQVVYAKIYDSVTPSMIIGEDGAILIDKLSQPSSVTLHMRGGKPEQIYTSNTDNNMIYQVRTFAKLIRENLTAHTYNRVSSLVMEILDTVREQNNIRFI